MSISGRNHISEINHDEQLNILYITVNPSSSTGLVRTKKEMNRNEISNLAIYNINTSTLSYLFDHQENKRILRFLFETGYNEVSESMGFNHHSSAILNKDIKKREPSNTLFLVTEGKKKDSFEFWKASKTGDSKELVKTFGSKDDWKLDVLNKKILFITKQPNEVKVETFDW